MPRMKEKALTAELAKRGFESISVKREHPDGRVEVEANKLHPVGNPSPATVADAARYIKTLRDSGQLAAAGEGAPARGGTHQIERDAQGRHVLRRKRFSIS
jgi:hypothetical protein